MNNLLTLSFWFNLYPPALQAWALQFLLIFFIAIFALGIFARIYCFKSKTDKLNKKAFTRLSDSLLVMGALGLLLTLFGYEQIPILSMRFGFVIWFAALVFWFYELYKFIYIKIPKIRAQNQARQETDKWLPKPKKS